jgi:FAD/FMN-containing dehydrogenase
MVLLGEPERLPLAIRGFVVRRVIHNCKTNKPGVIFPLAGPGRTGRLGPMAVAEGVMLDEAALAELEGTFRGDIVPTTHSSYDEHRKIWNGSIDRHPALIARCAGVADVISAVKFGRNTGLPVAVRSGGHSFPGLSVADDALMIDLSPMKGVRVDPEKRTARVQAGVLLGELDRETQAFGLAVPSGIVTHTGVAGLTLGGGIGWIMRKHGLSVDQLVSMDVVTAGGEFVKASKDENPDLFWGLCGGGGNFGIVTEFEFNCVPLGTQVLAGPVFWPMEQSGDVLRFYRDWVADAPDELMTIVVHRKAPPLPFVPQELHGKPVVMVIVCWVGDVEAGEKFIKPLREFGSPVADVCMVKPYLAHQAMLDPSFVPGRFYYFKSCDLAELNDEVIDITMERSLQINSPMTSFPIWQMGGAVSRVGDDETPFGGRKAAFTYNIGCCTETADGFDDERQWVRDFWSALEPWHQTVYVNFLDNEGEDRIRAAYGPKKYDRLKALKRQWDPDNFFRINQNIPPG